MESNNGGKTEAEERVNTAEAALRAFVESKQRDAALLETLIDEVNQAIADYLKLADQR